MKRFTPPPGTLVPIFLILSLLSTSCSLGASTIPTVATPTLGLAPGTTLQLSMDDFDAEALRLYGARGEIQALANRDIATNPDLTFELADPSLPANLLPSADVLVPAITLTPELEAYMITVMQQLQHLPMSDMETFASKGADWYFRERLMHSTHHLQPLTGVNQYDIRATTNFLWRIFQAAITNGQILYKTGNPNLRDAYVLVGQVDGRRWILIMDANSGAPITTFLRIRNNNINLYNEARTASYIARQISYGAQEISASQIPQHIRDNWAKQPSVVRILWWAASYQAAKLTKWIKFATPGAITSGWQAFQQWASGAAQWKFTPIVMFVITDECGNYLFPMQLTPGQGCGVMQ